jgi:hypothetical protein
MARWRHAVELALTDEDIESLGAIARSRSEPARRVERARMLLAYRENSKMPKRRTVATRVSFKAVLRECEKSGVSSDDRARERAAHHLDPWPNLRLKPAFTTLMFV